MQQIRQCAYFFGESFRQILALCDEIDDGRFFPVSKIQQRRQIEPQGDQRLSSMIVQFPCKMSSFLILSPQ